MASKNSLKLINHKVLDHFIVTFATLFAHNQYPCGGFLHQSHDLQLKSFNSSQVPPQFKLINNSVSTKFNWKVDPFLAFDCC